MVQIFLDCDGVLADFNSFFFQIFNQDPRVAELSLGTAEFWRRIKNHGSFYRDLPLIPDALELYHGVRHLDPIILTGCPEGGWAESQKVEWANEHFPGVKMITCRSREKRRHMKPGDVLIDDYIAYQDLWEEAGGDFIPHTSARDSLDRLAAMSIDARRL
jgi:5'(3')-deoxyribonucleotidase